MADGLAVADTLAKGGQGLGELLKKFMGNPALLAGDEFALPLNNKNKKLGITPQFYNVVDDYPWTLTPSKQRLNVPYIHLREFEQDLSCLYAQIAHWINNVKTATGDNPATSNPYQNLYHAKFTSTEFRFPYFENYDHVINPNWQKSKGAGETKLGADLLGVVTNMVQFLGMAPGTAVNQPQIWNGYGGPSTYTVSFTLFNTIGDIETIAKNIALKYRLQYSTLHDQRTAIMASPPAIFEVEIPGVRYSPAAIISTLSITNVGQMNLIDKTAIPDAYQFDINITELIDESRQILQDAQRNSPSKRIHAITQTETAGTALPTPSTAASQSVVNAGGGRTVAGASPLRRAGI